MNEEQLTRLNELSDRLEAIEKPLRTMQYNTPLNRDDEQRKLLIRHAKGESYNPQFVYSAVPSGWNRQLQDFLPELRSGEDFWEERLYEHIRTLLDSLHAVETHDPGFITSITANQYGTPSPELIAAAQKTLESQTEKPEQCEIPAEVVAEVMKKALLQAGLSEWTVVIEKSMSAGMSVRGVEKQVKVREGDLFSENAVKRLLVHEVGTHVFRSANGSVQPLRLLRMGLEGYLPTEEGLATYHEYSYGLQTGEDQRRYALRVIAAHLSLSNTFYDVFTQIEQHTTTDEAFKIVLRSKRGFTDTSILGAHLKDIVYLQGFLLVSSHLKEHPEDYSILMCGKVSLEMLPELNQLRAEGLLNGPKYLPNMLIEKLA